MNSTLVDGMLSLSMALVHAHFIYLIFTKQFNMNEISQGFKSVSSCTFWICYIYGNIKIWSDMNSIMDILYPPRKENGFYVAIMDMLYPPRNENDFYVAWKLVSGVLPLIIGVRLFSNKKMSWIDHLSLIIWRLTSIVFIPRFNPSYDFASFMIFLERFTESIMFLRLLD